MPLIVEDLARNYFTVSEIDRLRKRQPIKAETVGKFLNLAEEITRNRLRLQNSRLPQTHAEWVNNFVFRLTIATLVRVFKWYRNGRDTSLRSHNPEKTRNDHADAFIATYATYFDGVLSNDSDLRETYAETSAIVALMGADKDGR